MKKLSAILAVALVLVMVLSVMPAVFAADCHLVEGTGYKIAADNADGTLYFMGTITGGRFDCSANEAEAVAVYVEAVTGGYNLYMMDGTAKKYINMDDKSTGGKFVTAAAEATVYEWNATLNTLVVAEDSNNRAFGAGTTSTYTNFSSYDASQSGYNWGQFIAIAASAPTTTAPATTAPATTAPATTAPATTAPETTAAAGTTGATAGTQAPDATGDNTSIISMTVVMALAVTALAVLVIGNKKRMF